MLQEHLGLCWGGVPDTAKWGKNNKILGLRRTCEDSLGCLHYYRVKYLGLWDITVKERRND